MSLCRSAVERGNVPMTSSGAAMAVAAKATKRAGENRMMALWRSRIGLDLSGKL